MRGTPTRKPVSIDLLPSEVAGKCLRLPGLVFLDSALESQDMGRLSIVAAEPSQVLAGSAGEWGRFQTLLNRRLHNHGADLGLPEGAAIGYVHYDGSYCFGFYDHLLIYDHRSGDWLDQNNTADRIPGPTGRATVSGAPLRFEPDITREDFCRMVKTAQEYIAAGDIYQVNLSHRFSSRWSGEAFSLYQNLRELSPSPFAAFLDLGGKTILSSSPECFLRMSGRHILTRPIKGTRPRRSDPDADQTSAYELITSPKEIAELVMITDLERNDLGQVCEYGSVRVLDLLKLERYAQVHHLVSTVEGMLRPEFDQVSALRACFPGGSITGAPKKRAMEVIDEIEPSPRGLYTGAIGYFGYNGESQFNIAIRTLVLEEDYAHFHVGAGIVADSVPEREYEETLDKARGIFLAAKRSSR